MKKENISNVTQNTQGNSGGGGKLTNCKISQITNTSIDFFNYAKEVYSYLEDDISKGIFEQRLIFNITNSNITGLAPYVNNYLKPFYDNIIKIKENKFKNNIIIYGCTSVAKEIHNQVKSCGDVLFCDRNFQTIINFNGVKVISPNELISKYKDSTILLCVGAGKDIVTKFLLDNNVKLDKIINMCITDVEGQYFDEVIKLSSNEIFVDVGCFDGSTSVLFAKNTNYSYNKIYAFEPDESNLEKIYGNENFLNLGNTKLFNIGLWNKKEQLEFCSNSNEACTIANSGIASAKIIDNNTTIINCDTLDNVLGDELVTYIKMDIEGAELNALKGAKNIITKFKPKLAISIYHKPEDIIDIPMYIKFLVPEYKLYLRHHSSSMSETVIYAILD